MTGAVGIILAAGSGERLGGELPKGFVELAGRTLLARAAEAAAGAGLIDSLVVAVPPDWESKAEEELEAFATPVRVVTGGPTRQDSVRLALRAVPPEARAAACHDAARPLASPGLFAAVLAALDDADGAVPVIPVADTVKRTAEGFVVATERREQLALAQTPQAFRLEALRTVHQGATHGDASVTDDAVLLERARYRVRVVPGEAENFKITTVDDLARAEFVLARRAAALADGAPPASGAAALGGG